MEKWKNSAVYKVLLWILLVVCGIATVACAAGIALCQEEGAYQNAKEDNLRRLLERANERYSVMALIQYMGWDEFDELEEAGFSYGIRKVDGEEDNKTDRGKKSDYLLYHFSDEPDYGNLYSFQYEVTPETTYSYYEDGFWKAASIYKSGYIETADLSVSTDGTDNMGNYEVLSVIPETVIYDSDWMYGTMYQKSMALNDLAYRLRYPAAVGVGIAFLTGVAAFVLLCCLAGHKKGEDAIVLSRVARLPFEVECIGVVILEVLCMFGAAISMDSLDCWDTLVPRLSLLIPLVILAGCVMVAFRLNLMVRIKAGAWWRNTVFWRLLRQVKRLCAKPVAWWKSVWRAAGENMSLLVKAGVVMAVIAAGELCGILWAAYSWSGMELILILWLLEKVVLYGIVFAVLFQLKKLQEGGRHIAEGDTAYQVDTAGMFWEFKKHGENLNSIGNGIQHAVEERMKSERFRTELITNVSHDIKTPLTSIINYVDLLEKEELENPAAREYLEVLSRQSGRLKKLIEDLMEASKASTGNLAVNLERLEAGVFLVQTVGEFEEKTKAAELELIVAKPETPVYIMADGRHFWRVIDNLMNNICKYAQPGTRVYINLEAEEGEVRVTFRNTSRYALNISSEELLERFVRGDSSRNTEGSGLGLSIAQSLMELMQARMELYVDGDLFKVVLRFDKME
ncbi:MAG: sensor histidine kinase [Roseburia sp.]